MKRLQLSLSFLAMLGMLGCGNDSGGTAASLSSDDNQATGATGSSTDSEPDKPKKIIAYSTLTLTNPFFKVIAENMQHAASDAGYEMLVVSGEQDPKRQADQVDDFINKQVSAIVLTPCDRRAVGAAIRRANEAGIPVFTNDAGYDGDEGKVECHIATDNYQGGKLAGEAMVKLLGKAGGDVAVLHFAQAQSCQLRVKGFTEIVEAHNKGGGAKINIVAVLESGAERARGLKAAQDALEANPNLAAIFAINDPAALGAYAALKAVDKEDQVKIIGFDGEAAGKQAILEGKIVCDPIQYPDQIGKRTIEMILKYFDGEEVPGEILIPSKLYYQADARQDPVLREE